VAKKKIIVNTAHVVMLEKPSKLVELHAKEFSIDLKVQRILNEARADAMADKFQPHALGMVTASKREDGHVYLLDGAHRISAARKANYEGLIATRLFENLTVQEEAELFLSLNSSRAVQAIDRFKVRITQGEPVAVGINNVLKAYGLHVEWANNESLGVISAIAALEHVYHGAGVWKKGDYPDLVDKVIRSLYRAYGEKAERATYSKIMLEGLGIFCASFGARIDYDRLQYVLEGTVPRQIAVQARTLRDARGKKNAAGLGRAAAEVIHQMYNHRFKAKLPEFGAVDVLNALPEGPAYDQDPLYVDANQYVTA
jgi:hypothetical protein